MFVNISWASYWTVLSISLLVYYLYVGFRYFRYSPSSLVSSSREASGDNSSSFTNEVEAYLCAIGTKQIAKPALIFGLQRIALKYKDAVSDDRNELTKAILILCKDKCAVTLSEEEVKQVWLV
jgi:hypothetical protein